MAVRPTGDRYSVRFELNGEPFTGELLVAVNNNGRRIFYDILKINRTDSSVSGATDIVSRKPEVNNIGSDTDIVPQNNDVVKGKNEKVTQKIKNKIEQVLLAEICELKCAVTSGAN